MWIIYSLLGAFFQASEMAIKKKTLQTKGANNFIAFAAFLVAGIFIGLFFLLQNNEAVVISHLTNKFWIGIAAAVLVNVIATYFLYKALDISDLSYLMPYMTLTSLTVIIPPMILFHEYPSPFGFVGIAVIVAGALIMDYKKTRTQEEHDQHMQNRKGLLFFLITALCFTVSPSMTKLAVVESSPIFATLMIHVLMGLAFGVMILLLGETGKIKNIFKLFKRNEKKIFLFAITLSGIVIALSNMSINYAFTMQSVAYVMAIKRVMPLFAFIIGYFYFKEHFNVKRKLVATVIMVAGAVLITAF